MNSRLIRCVAAVAVLTFGWWLLPDPEAALGSAWSLLPPMLAIFLALWARQVVASLFLGVWLGATMLAGDPGRGFLRLILREQGWPGDQRRLSLVMWDTFTGSAAYGDILKRMLHPALLVNLFKEIVMGFFRRTTPDAEHHEGADTGVLGRVYEDGEAIVTQGEVGNCMYVVQQGSVQVTRETEDQEVPLAMVHEGGFFGEMALFGEDLRTATVRARGQTTVLTVDQHTLLRQITENPSLAFHLIREMAARLRHLNSKHARVLQHDRRNWENRPAEKPVV